MELPYHLKTLEPLIGALDTLRYLRGHGEHAASVDSILSALSLSDRSFSKAIRRLVTKGYVQMDASSAYRLSEAGRRAAEELVAYESATGSIAGVHEESSTQLAGRLALICPDYLVAQQTAEVTVGIALDDGGIFEQPADLLVRLSAINADPTHLQDASLPLSDRPVQHQFSVTAHQYTTVRIRVQVYQLLPDDQDVVACGGLYVDLPVTSQPADSPARRIAFGSTLTLQPTD